MAERLNSRPITEFDVGKKLKALVFSADGKCLLGSDKDGVRVWRVQDGTQIATMEARKVGCLAVSKDGKWVAAGTNELLLVWSATTFELDFTYEDDSCPEGFMDIDFSPDSTRLVATCSHSPLALVFDVATRKEKITLNGSKRFSRYSPKGDRIASREISGIYVWDSRNGGFIRGITSTSEHCNNFQWSGNTLFVVWDNKTISQFDTSTGSKLSSWSLYSVQDRDVCSMIGMPKHGEYIAYAHCASYSNVEFWDTWSHDRFDIVKCHGGVRCLAFSLDDKIFAVAGWDGKLSVRTLPTVNLSPRLRELVVSQDHSWKDVLQSAAHLNYPKVDIYRVLCERLEELDRIPETAECFHQMASELRGEKNLPRESVQWTLDFKRRSSKKQELLGDTSVAAQLYDEAVARYAAAFSLNPSSLKRILMKQTKTSFTSMLWKRLLDDVKEVATRTKTHQFICECLETTGHATEAVECYLQLKNELGGPENLKDEYLQWTLDFRRRCFSKLVSLGDRAVDVRRHDAAISHYSVALSLALPSPEAVLKRSKVFMAIGSWKQALDDADKAIELDPSSQFGYDMKYALFLNSRDYEAIGSMLSMMQQSPDPNIQKLGDHYIDPLITRAEINKIVQKTIRHLPRMLINTVSGRLSNKSEQASAFESSPIFDELVSSMTRRVDYVRIKSEVRQYFKYVMLSHKWEDNEPLFHQVVHIAVYDLEKSPTHDKLQIFCKIVQDSGFNWAWSDTCCIDKTDHFVLQEALVAMFRWYKGAAMVIVFLRGVRSSSPRGALVKSVWNTRVWTLQEYVASKDIRFYTEDWTIYQDLKLMNHKESPEVISEMEQATGVSADQLKALRPGLGSIREKLRLASTRQTTLVEDTAYSLLGIFSVVGIPAIYGEGEASLGRLLANLLTRSGDVSILAWIGESSRFNSCLPARIIVFDSLATSHIPPPIPNVEMEKIITSTQSSSFDLDAALRLYDRLSQLPTPRFAETRLTLQCIAFRLLALSSHRTTLGRVYRADTVEFGMVEIKTRQDLSKMKCLYLVHPWLDALLERGVQIEDDDTPPPSPSADDDELLDEEPDEENEIDDDFSPLEEPESILLPAPINMDRETRARRLAALVRQPFGALLLALQGRSLGVCKRVAADSLIMVRLRDEVSLTDIVNDVRTFDVL